VGSRGCYYDCSFCGAAISANRDILVRHRSPENVLAEMEYLRSRWGVVPCASSMTCSWPSRSS